MHCGHLENALNIEVSFAEVVGGMEYSGVWRAAALGRVRRLQVDASASIWAIDRPGLRWSRFHIWIDAMSVAEQGRFF